MADFKKQEESQNEDLSIQISMAMLRDLLRSFQKLWWLVALLAALFTGIALFYSVRSYRPMYKAEATFTVETYTTQGGYTFYYDNQTAAQMAQTFPFLLDSDLLLERVKIDLNTEFLNGVPSAQVIKNSNLFTLSVTSRDPQAAYDILHALIKHYPTVAEYVIGKTQLNMIDYPEFPSQPYNSTAYLHYATLGLLASLVLSALIIFIHALSRNTVRKESDVTEKLYTNWIGGIPLVVPKGNTRNRRFDLSIHNNKVGTSFKESFRGIGLQVARQMGDHQVLLLTATNQQEGVTTVAQNLALELADQGKRILLLDGNFRETLPNGTGLEAYLLGEKSLNSLPLNTEESVQVLRCNRALTDQEFSQAITSVAQLIQMAKKTFDYVLIDGPACQNLDAVSIVAEPAEAILYIIQQDNAKLPQIMNCFEDLSQFEAKIIGCVLNGIQTGFTSYGYGYGYGYGSSYHYGRYGGYGYGEEKSRSNR